MGACLPAGSPGFFSYNNSEQLTFCSAVPACPSVSSSEDSLPPGPLSEAIISFESEPSHFEAYCCDPVRKEVSSVWCWGFATKAKRAQRSALQILTHSSFPTQPSLQLQRMRDPFPREIASTEPHVQSLTHRLGFLMAEAWLRLETQMHVTCLLILFCSRFVSQVEPFEDAPDSQGAVNMVLRLRWGAPNAILTVWHEPFFLLSKIRKPKVLAADCHISSGGAFFLSWNWVRRRTWPDFDLPLSPWLCYHRLPCLAPTPSSPPFSSAVCLLLLMEAF